MERLSNSPAFQRAAVSAVRAGESVKGGLEEAARDPAKAAGAARGFLAALRAEVEKDLARVSGSGGGGGAGGAGGGAPPPARR